MGAGSLIALSIVITALAMALGVALALLWRSSRPTGLRSRKRLSGGQWVLMRTRVTQAMEDAVIAPVMQAGDVSDTVRHVIAQNLIVAATVEWSYGEVDLDTLIREVPTDDQVTMAQTAWGVVEASGWWAQVQKLGEAAQKEVSNGSC